jgi:dTMP kinase
MPDKAGIFIVLEGADGSGKGTQFKLLAERLKAVGFDVEVFDFPRYHKTSSHFVQRYLNGDYGPAKDISPYTASLFYALDRYEAAPAIKKALAQGKIVLANRYVGSNMAHQGSKFNDPVQQRGFFVWEDGLEFQMLGIPRPDFNFFLRVPAEVAYKLIAKKDEREYTKQSHDEHEKDIDHLRRAVATYDTLCQLFPKDFFAIECVENNKLLSVAEINDKIWEKLKPLLPNKPPHAGRDVVVLLEAANNTSEKTAQNAASTKAVALSDKLSEENKSAGRLIININKISLLAISALQTCNLTARITSLEWPSNDQYQYYTQARLPKKISAIYNESMEKIIRLHQAMLKEVGQQNNSTIRDVITYSTPLAALSTIKISASATELQRAINQLQANPLEEVRWLAQQILTAARKASSHGFRNELKNESIDLNSQKSQINDVISKLVADHLPQTLPANTEPVALLEALPRNEFDLLVDSIYPYSTSSRRDIAADLQNWTYEQKIQAFMAASSQPNALPLTKVRYLWNVICDKTSFDQIKELIQVNDVQVQPATPRYGYAVPEVVEQAGIDELFIACFDESLKLFSSLQAAGFEEIAPYATLIGHKNRWQFSTSAEALLINPVASVPSEANILLKSMLEKVAETHPLIGDWLSSKNSEPNTQAHIVNQVTTQEESKKSSPRRKRRAKRPKK